MEERQQGDDLNECGNVSHSNAPPHTLGPYQPLSFVTISRNVKDSSSHPGGLICRLAGPTPELSVIKQPDALLPDRVRNYNL